MASPTAGSVGVDTQTFQKKPTNISLRALKTMKMSTHG